MRRLTGCLGNHTRLQTKIMGRKQRIAIPISRHHELARWQKNEDDKVATRVPGAVVAEELPAKYQYVAGTPVSESTSERSSKVDFVII